MSRAFPAAERHRNDAPARGRRHDDEDEELFVGAATEPPDLDDPENQPTTPGVAWRFDEDGQEVV